MRDFAELNAHHAISSASLIALTKAITAVKLLTHVHIIVDSAKVIPKLVVYRTSSAVLSANNSELSSHTVVLDIPESMCRSSYLTMEISYQRTVVLSISIYVVGHASS